MTQVLKKKSFEMVKNGSCVGDATKQNTFSKKTVFPKCIHASNVYSRPWWCNVRTQFFADSISLKLPSKTELDITLFRKGLMTYLFTSVSVLCKTLHFNWLLRKPFFSRLLKMLKDHTKIVRVRKKPAFFEKYFIWSARFYQK